VDADDEKPGFSASAGMDIFGRPISFLFPPTASLIDGAMPDISELPLEQSINYILARWAGLPDVYTTAEPLVLDKFRTGIERSKIGGGGLWAIGRTYDFILWDTHTIRNDVLILPKLFRRLVGFFDRYQDFKELREYMLKRQDDLQLVNNPTPRWLASLMSIKGRRLKLKVSIEEILFSPK
jgi:hypothetical protein